MNTILVWDTETSGLPLFDQPSEDPRQPHIVQLGAVLLDAETRQELATLDVIVKPDGWTIPDEVASVHGITTEKAHLLGVPERDAVALFMALGGGRTHVAHNSSFDERIVRIALKRHFSDEVLGKLHRLHQKEVKLVLAGPKVEQADIEDGDGAGAPAGPGNVVTPIKALQQAEQRAGEKAVA